MKKLNRFLYLLALLKFILPFFLQSSVYEPHRDEFLYLAEGSHPAFGFMEVPPLLSVFAWITRLFGNGMFWIKFWPSLFGAMNFFLVGKFIISMGAKIFALILLFFCFFFTGFLRVHFLFQPNFLEIFFYTVIAIGLVQYVKTSENKWLYITGAGAGLGLLSKYSVAFYLISLVPALLLTKHRTIFLNRHFYFALGLAFLIFLPNLIWQFNYHLPVFYHMHELTTTQLQYVKPSSFLIDQMVMFLPCCFIWLTGLLYLFLNKEGRTFIFLGLAYSGVLAILLWFHGKSYYTLGLYPILFGFGSLVIEKWTKGSRFFLRFIFSAIIIYFGIKFLFISLPLMAPANLAAHYQKTHAARLGILRWEDQQDHELPQDFADMLGWDEMAEKVSSAFHSLDHSQQAKTIIFCDNYGMAGAVTYYGKKYHLPAAYSDNASFLYWISDSINFQNIVLVESDPEEIHHDFIKQFSNARITDSVTNPYAREKGTAIMVLTGASDLFRKFFNEKLKADRLKTRGY
jgi:Dolichyl-phosphate-mannose-protein mannosyltransferase